MSIMTVTTRITRQWLERKTKSDLAQMYLDLLDDNVRLENEAKAAQPGTPDEVRRLALERLSEIMWASPQRKALTAGSKFTEGYETALHDMDVEIRVLAASQNVSGT